MAVVAAAVEVQSSAAHQCHFEHEQVAVFQEVAGPAGVPLVGALPVGAFPVAANPAGVLPAEVLPAAVVLVVGL